MNSPIRIVIADDHVLVRQGIRAFLETHADLAIVGEAEDGPAAIRLCIDMIVALGTSMPTSITVVATSTLVFPRRN